jgi:WD40 repeat protein
MKRLTLLFLAVITAPALAVSTSYWTQTTEADFKSGTLDNVVATNLGELKLSRAVNTLLEEDPRISTVNKLIEAPDGTIYAGTGPSAVLLQIKDQKVSTAATIPDATDILSMTFDKSGALLLGTGGENGKILRIDKPGAKPHAIFSADGVQYIWGLTTTPDGNVYAATGPTGKLFQIKPDGTSKVLLETDENNLLSLISDGKEMLYIGTDPHGLVFRVNRTTGESFVVYNAPEAEITALALDAKGNLYAATGEAREEPAQAPPQAAPDADKSGQPEGGQTGVPIPSTPPGAPKKPVPPDPNPSRPDPIPKAHASSQQRAISSLCFFSDDDAAMPPNDGSGQDPKGRPDSQPSENPDLSKQPPVDTSSTGEPRPEGNAVYKIDPDGFVTEVFRQPVLVLAMVEKNGTLLIATGSEGQIYQVDPDADETIALAKVDAKQVTALLPAHDGQVFVGMANTGSIATMSEGFADSGTYLSPVLDATQISRFGKVQLHGSLPAGTSLLVSTRSGNVKEASEKNWSKWTDDVAAHDFLPVTSPSARFLQYRLTLATKDPNKSPVVDDVSIAYQLPNLAPQIKAIHLLSGADAAAQAAAAAQQQAGGPPPATPNPAPTDARRMEPQPVVNVNWDATDPNNDSLTYSLYFRRGTDLPWILLRDGLTDNNFQWDTRLVADGRYQVKVVASDAGANAPGSGKTASRVSEPIVVDNTPPDIGDIKWKQAGESVHLELTAVDQSSTVAAVDYIVDSGKDWQLVLPAGNIYDSPTEEISFDIQGLAPGTHQVTLRATDSKGNQSFQNVFVKVAGPTASR